MFKQHEAPDLASLRRDFLKAAEQSFDRMFGRDGRNGLVTFTQREEQACELGDEVSRWLLGKHLAREECRDPGKVVDCPFCGKAVSEESPQRVAMERRRILTRRGPVEFDRASRWCPKCRRVFFPPR